MFISRGKKVVTKFFEKRSPLSAKGVSEINRIQKLNAYIRISMNSADKRSTIIGCIQRLTRKGFYENCNKK